MKLNVFFICIEEHKIVTAVTVSTQDKKLLGRLPPMSKDQTHLSTKQDLQHHVIHKTQHQWQKYTKITIINNETFNLPMQLI